MTAENVHMLNPSERLRVKVLFQRKEEASL